MSYISSHPHVRAPVFAMALRSKPFAVFWCGQTLSALGDGAFYTALSWQVLVLTHSGAAIDLILPMVTNIAPWLKVAAAAGLVLVQIGAGAIHLARHETRQVPVNVVLFLLAVLVLIGRVAIVPVA